jgi:enoyl-CoA hydratase
MKGQAQPIFETLLIEIYDHVGVIILNRPQVLNALSQGLITDLRQALDRFERDPKIGAIILTGSKTAFAAGADIKEMKDKSFTDAYHENFITNGWERITKCRKPIIAAVAGYALGGGCELALMCDFIVAAPNAMFGQPEVTLGTMPGAGGTQRLAHLIGKAKTMDLCLTGRMMDATEAERSGLVSRILPLENFLDETLKIAHHIAGMPRTSLMLIKEAINAAYETSLREGIHLERRLFHATFSTHDQKEGMTAFLEKRPANFKNS